MKTERRYAPITELRVNGEGDQKKIVGYAAVFNSMSEDLGGFREQIAPGAFKSAIRQSDTRALFNHDTNFVLGRKSAGTLKIKEDDKGLRFENTPPDTQWARDLITSIDRGDIKEMSFAFMLAKDGDHWDETDDGAVRTITKIAKLPDVSPVTYPAYPETEVALRSLEDWKEIEAAKSKDKGGGNNGDTPKRDARFAARKRKLELMKKSWR